MIELLAHFFNGMKIKYEDHPFVFIPPVLLILVIAPIYAIFGVSSLPVILTLAVFVVFGGIFHAYRGVQQEIQAHQCQVQALISLHQQLQFRYPVPSVFGWAAKPDLLNLIQARVQLHKPENILELGSGISTIVVGYTCEKVGNGHIWSLDHDLDYLKKSKELIRLHQLDDFASLLPAPLTDTKVGEKTHSWYSLESLPKNLRFDMLIVDGPPHTSSSMARYPAVEVLYERLNPGAVIILDDTNREDEQESIRLWTEHFPALKIDRTFDIPNAAVLIKEEISTNKKVHSNGQKPETADKSSKSTTISNS